MPPVRILGAGPSGLAAAITLARAGREVDVYERQTDCGARFGGDLQGLESFSSGTDVLEELRHAGIATDFAHRGFSSGWQFNGRRADLHAFTSPAFYVVRRGTDAGSLDQSLKGQALAAGARLHLGQTLDPTEAHIIATGPRQRRPYAICRGIVFRTDAPDLAVALLDDRAGLKGYSYLLVSNGEGCLCTSLWSDFGRVHRCLAEARRQLLARWPVRVEDERPVGGWVHFSGQPRWQEAGRLMVGEAAGLQDFLWAFGLRAALRSGILAGHALLEGHDFASRANEQFTAFIRGGVVNRFLWEIGRFGQYRAPMAALRWRGAERLMYDYYRSNRLQRFLYPFARGYVKVVHPNLTV